MPPDHGRNLHDAGDEARRRDADRKLNALAKRLRESAQPAHGDSAAAPLPTSSLGTDNGPVPAPTATAGSVIVTTPAPPPKPAGPESAPPPRPAAPSRGVAMPIAVAVGLIGAIKWLPRWTDKRNR